MRLTMPLRCAFRSSAAKAHPRSLRRNGLCQCTLVATAFAAFVASSSATAVGALRTRQQPLQVTERFRAQLREPASLSAREPFRVSCASDSLCVAVDSGGDLMTSTSPTATGTKWAIGHVAGTSSFLGVACPSTSLCVATNSSGDVLTSTDPAGGSATWTSGYVGALRSITCPSASLCVAVGAAAEATTTEPSGGAATWRLDPNLDPTVGPECGKYGPGLDCRSALTEISCPTSSFCAALNKWGGPCTHPTRPR